MKIITKEIGKPAEVKELDTLSLKTMQSLVGGLIQPVYYKDMICWVNEEGKLMGLQDNILLMNKSMDYIYDTLCGNVFFTNEDEDAPGLNAQQIDELLEKLNNGYQVLTQTNIHIIPVLTI